MYLKYRDQYWPVALALTGVLLVVYAPVLTRSYLFHDDWIQFLDRDSHCSAFRWDELCQRLGRPGGHYVLCFLYQMFDTVAGAWRARLVIVAGIVAFALLQLAYFRALGVDRITAACIALGISLLPGMLVFSYWIIAGSIVFSLLASTGAALLVAAFLRNTGSRWRLSLLGGACVLQVVALLIYQTGAMYLWTLTAVMLAMRLRTGLKTSVRPVAVYSLVGIVPMGAYFIWFNYLTRFSAALRARDAARATMFTDLPDKTKWFLEVALPRASSLWFFELPRGFGLAALLFLAVSTALLCARLARNSWRDGDRRGGFLYAAYPFLVAMLGVLAYSPMLATVFSLETFRSTVPLSALMFATGAVHLGLLLRTETWPQSTRLFAASGFAIGLCCLAAYSLVARMVLPAAAEYSFLQKSLKEAAEVGPTVLRVHAIVPDIPLDTTTDEMYNLSVQQTQDIEPMIRVIARDAGLHIGQVSYDYQRRPQGSDGAVILDLAELTKTGLWKPAFPPHAKIVMPTLAQAPQSSMPPEDDAHPKLLRSFENYNLVAYHGRIYGVPQALGTLSDRDWDEGRVDKLAGVVIDDTVEAALARLSNTPATMTNGSPVLLRSYGGFNVLRFGGRFYGVPQSLGALSQADWESGRVDKLPGVVIEDTIDKLVTRLPR